VDLTRCALRNATIAVVASYAFARRSRHGGSPATLSAIGSGAVSRSRHAFFKDASFGSFGSFRFLSVFFSVFFRFAAGAFGRALGFRFRFRVLSGDVPEVRLHRLDVLPEALRGVVDCHGRDLFAEHRPHRVAGARRGEGVVASRRTIRSVARGFF